MILVDLHSHTNASHGQNSVAEMYTAAQQRGLAVFGFSEHSPRPAAYSYPTEYREHLLASFAAYVREVQALQTSRAPRVLLGMELDWFPAERAFMEASIAAYPFDYILGGIHFLGSWGFDFTRDDWNISPQQCFGRYENYFRVLKDMAESGLVNIAAHPDIIKLFTVDVFRQWIALKTSQDLVASALIAIRDAGMVMEISSAGLRKPCQEIYPGPEIMRLAADLAVPISFGADSHCVNTPAFAFPQLADYAHSFGYTESHFFEHGTRHTMPF
ncbi:MAG: histidinol-phosphatase [Bilophila sp.]